MSSDLKLRNLPLLGRKAKMNLCTILINAQFDDFLGCGGRRHYKIADYVLDLVMYLKMS